MQIGRHTLPRTALCASDANSIRIRGRELATELIGRQNFSGYFHFLVTGREPGPGAQRVLDATLVAIAEHGFVPSVQASRMTFAAAPECLQGAVAAGLLGCGSVILGAAEDAGQLLIAACARATELGSLDAAAEALVAQRFAAGMKLPGYGHPEHKVRDPRVAALFGVAREVGGDACDPRFMQAAEAVEAVIPRVYGKALRLNVSAAIPAVLLGIGFPSNALKGIPLLARTASLIAHLVEEMAMPSGFALAYQATRELQVQEGGRP
ncbi:citryl-CoA lyase [Piscinibacter sakaiensis]|uniref:citrate synthase (unknown stereospecificity) n=1 Tax=Piscinibacter sakaiensis TaxID=1547922 RepID=A0A0K8P6W1_PISS1|nr:citryl-CoA lyase [Piscinibacter sakaiensis]GAP38351.1 citrate synthase (si) [Piscinibacter sakaiensis]